MARDRGNTADPSIEDLAAPEVEDTSELEETNGPEASDKAKPEAKAKGPKRGKLPEGTVTPVGLAKILTEKKMHTNKAGEVIEVKPQMVYSYMKNSSKDDRLETHEVTDDAGVSRQVFKVDDAIAWWERKNKRVTERKANAADKAAKAAAKPAATSDAGTSTGEPAVEAE